MVGGLPHTRLRGVGRRAVAPDRVIEAAELSIDLPFAYELPLALEGFEVSIRLAAVPLVHEKQRVDPLDRPPPLLLHPPRLPRGCALAEKAAVGLVPAV